MENKSFNAIYQNAPLHQVDELLAFRSTHPVQQRSMVWSGTILSVAQDRKRL
jgi:hypothetical protein